MRAILLIAAAAALGGSSPNIATATAGSPSFSIADATVIEGGSVQPKITKSAVASSYSKITITISDGSAKAGIDYVRPAPITITIANKALSALGPTIATIQNAKPDGDRTVLATITAVRNARISRAQATITIKDDDPPAPADSWISAPLHDGGFARVKANSALWDMTGPGAGRPLIAGEIVAVFFNGWGAQADGRISFAIYALSDGSDGRSYADDLEGVAPVGSPPQLPADWWVPGLVVANKTCANAYNAAQPGIVQGGIYRAAMVAGSHMAIASGQTGSAGSVWSVFAADDPWMGARIPIAGDCLTGQ